MVWIKYNMHIQRTWCDWERRNEWINKGNFYVLMWTNLQDALLSVRKSAEECFYFLNGRNGKNIWANVHNFVYMCMHIMHIHTETLEEYLRNHKSSYEGRWWGG